mmetsp:Transcript_23988/g.55956  ORF Transcript_23988/g.55956 Transcript_23988/m.55956 type:complete len:100 (-) Transcript_23988:46-345(-)
MHTTTLAFLHASLSLKHNPGLRLDTTIQALDGMKREELVQECKKRGLKISGKKAELKKRIEQDEARNGPSMTDRKKPRLLSPPQVKQPAAMGKNKRRRG